MKKLLLPLLSILLLTACQKQIVTDDIQKEIAGVTAKKTSCKITVCHKEGATNCWHTINIDIHAWPAHQAHGDVRLDDQDGDGYVPNNKCGYGKQGDCNDNNAAVHPGAIERCGNRIDENCNGMNDDLCSLSIGDFYQGGIIAYLLQPGDPGYSTTATHGIIAAPYDQSTAAPWGCLYTEIPGADGTALGTGNQNTIDIMAGCSTAGIAARICGDLVLNGYSDWYLPSKDELDKLYINRAVIGGFASNSVTIYYWSSSEYNDGLAWTQRFFDDLRAQDGKQTPDRVRAIRAF